MFEVEFIRKKHFVEGWSIRTIARRLSMSRATVRKALRSAETPKYTLQEPRPSPIMDPVADVVLSWLEADKDAPTKQRHTAKRIYDRLVEEYGFTGCESTVRRFVAKHKKKEVEVFIPLTSDYGEVAEVDWGQAHVSIAGKPTVAHLFCLKLKRSNTSFAVAFPTEKLEAFLAGHVAAFEFIAGVPATLIYDNPKTAVTRILSGPERELHQVFSSLRAHYLFDSAFCRPGEANEKGSVENLVGFVRRNALVPIRDFDSFAHLNEHLLAWCTKQSDRNRTEFEREKMSLRELPAAPFKAAISRHVVANRLSLISFDCNRYSVPSKYAGATLRLDAHWDRLELFFSQTLACSHKRCYSRGETIMDIFHYLPALERKPRAVCHAAVVRSLPAVFQVARKRLVASRPDGYREFAAILLLSRDFSLNELTKALKEAINLPTLSAVVVRQMIQNSRQREAAPVTPPEALASIRVFLPNLAIYDSLVAR